MSVFLAPMPVLFYGILIGAFITIYVQKHFRARSSMRSEG